MVSNMWFTDDRTHTSDVNKHEGQLILTGDFDKCAAECGNTVTMINSLDQRLRELASENYPNTTDNTNDQYTCARILEQFAHRAFWQHSR